MLPISLNPLSTDSLTVQIVTGIEELMMKGVLVEGSRLPSCEELSKKIGAHRLTVLAAYQELRRRGRVVSTPGRGTVVIQDPRSLRREVLRKLAAEFRKKGKNLGFSPQEMAEAVIGPEKAGAENKVASVPYATEWDLFAPITLN